MIGNLMTMCRNCAQETRGTSNSLSRDKECGSYSHTLKTIKQRRRILWMRTIVKSQRNSRFAIMTPRTNEPSR